MNGPNQQRFQSLLLHTCKQHTQNSGKIFSGIWLLVVKIGSKKQATRSALFLSLVAPITDQWNEVKCSEYVKAALNMWAILCFSLTIYYGGELASSLTVYTPPEYPQTIFDLCRMKPEIFSQSNYRQDQVEDSQVAFDLENYINVRAMRMRNNSYQAACLPQVSQKIRRTFCPKSLQKIIVLDVRSPWFCENANANPSYQSNVAFIDYNNKVNQKQLLFEAAPSVWWTHSVLLPEFQHVYPYICKGNYFAKLFDFVVSGFAAGGIPDRILKLNKHSQKYWFGKRRYASILDETVFTPLKLKELLAVRQVFFFLFGAITFVFGLELIPTLIKLAVEAFGKCLNAYLVMVMVLENILADATKTEDDATICEDEASKNEVSDSETVKEKTSFALTPRS